jgi:hypothetical protein
MPKTQLKTAQLGNTVTRRLRGSVGARQPVNRPAQSGLERTLVCDPAATSRLPARIVKLIPAHRQKDPALTDLGDLFGVGVQMAAGKRRGMDDQALEDAAVRHDVFDNADAVSVAVVHRSAVLHAEIGDRISELIEGR